MLVDRDGQVRRLFKEVYPDTKKVVLVMDNLNTHGTTFLYEEFEEAAARHLAQLLGDSLHSETR